MILEQPGYHVSVNKKEIPEHSISLQNCNIFIWKEFYKSPHIATPLGTLHEGQSTRESLRGMVHEGRTTRDGPQRTVHTESCRGGIWGGGWEGGQGIGDMYINI